MKLSPVEKLSSYVEALKPIIYINHFDFEAVDKLISQVGKNIKIAEYNDANGYVDFKTKVKKSISNLGDFLSYMQEIEIPHFLVLKDIHFHFQNPEILAKLKSIAFKNMYKDDFNVTIFIVSSKLVIPEELEKLITIFDIPLPDLNSIEKIIENFCSDLNISIDKDTLDHLSLSFKGLSEFEIIQILNLSYQNNGSIEKEDKELILEEKEQIIKKSGLLEIVKMKESINDIGGLEELKKWLGNKAKIYKNLDKAIKFGVDLPKGVLIVGIPGCGKSLSAKAAAKLFEVPLLRLDLGKLLGKYVGESEENLRKAIKVAEAVSPCVLWLDEIEKAFAGLGDNVSGNEVTFRLFGYFLTWLQEKESPVFTIATSNDISNLPPELLRKGRFDEIFFVDLPKKDEIKNILKIHLEKRKKWNKNIDIISLLKDMDDFSGADIESIVQETIENAFINNEEQITTESLRKIIKSTKPLGLTMKDKIQKTKSLLTEMDIKNASS